MYSVFLDVFSLSEQANFERVAALARLPGLPFREAFEEIARLLRTRFPAVLSTEFLEPFRKVVDRYGQQIVVATTNYDLVLDTFFRANGIRYADGFDTGNPARWIGFENKLSDELTYLKLHGSVDWYTAPNEWFLASDIPASPRGIYKWQDSESARLVRPEYVDQLQAHWIIGGGKTQKILLPPFVDLFRLWSNALSVSENLFIVGFSGSDIHLIQQMKGLLYTNTKLRNIFIINPDFSDGAKVRDYFFNVIPPSAKICCAFFAWNEDIDRNAGAPLHELIDLSREEIDRLYVSTCVE